VVICDNRTLQEHEQKETREMGLFPFGATKIVVA
jgi:hypothetical protein